MSHIRTVRHPLLSRFQSLVDDLILGRHPADTGPLAYRGQARPTLEHTLVHAATEYVERKLGGREVSHEPPRAVGDREGYSAAWTCVRLAGELFLAALEGDGSRKEQLEGELQDSLCDPGWSEAIIDYLEYFGPGGKAGQVPYVTWQSLDDFVLETLPANARVALVADWGTGTRAAEELLVRVAEKDPHVLLHLGDIYYSGTVRETHHNFLQIIDRVFDRARRPMPVYTLTGNHDMYSGGVGYYQLLPRLNPSPPYAPHQGQPASFFSLRSPGGAWQLLAMDTGLHDRDPFTVSTGVTYLEPREAQWHLDKIERFAGQGGKTILLSHHQLFSAFSAIGEVAEKPSGLEAFNPKLLETFRAVLERGLVNAWFWGHEHSLGVYRPYGPLERGRCIGHGAIPVLATQAAYQVLDALPDPPRLVDVDGKPLELDRDADGVYAHGYVILDLDDASRRAEASYHVTPDDRVVYRETLD